MILKCPRCNTDKNIGSYSRFYIYRCDSCRFRFRGIHADISKIKNFFFCILNPLGTDQWAWYHSTCCPYCGCMIDMGEGSGKGFIAPENCRFCHRRLPTWGAVQRSEDHLDDWATVEHWRQVEYLEESIRVRDGQVDPNLPIVWNPDGTRANVFPKGTFTRPDPPTAPPKPVAAAPAPAAPKRVAPPKPPKFTTDEAIELLKDVKPESRLKLVRAMQLTIPQIVDVGFALRWTFEEIMALDPMK